jgi:6-phosphogluconolactonase
MKTFLYLSESERQAISVYHFDRRRQVLDLVQSVPVAGKVMPFVLSPDLRHLHAAVRSEPFCYVSFRIDRLDGTLTRIGGSLAADSMIHLAIDPAGRHVFGACNHRPGGDRSRRTAMVAVNAIGPAGCVQAPARAWRTPAKAHSVTLDPGGRFAFVCCCDDDSVQRYRVDGMTGGLDADGLAPVWLEKGCGPRHMRFHPNGQFACVVTEYHGTVVVFRHDPQRGGLEEIQTISAVPPGFDGDNARAADLHFTPDGAWLYASCRATSTIAVFRVDPVSGGLAAAGHFPAAREPRSFAIDPLGTHLFSNGYDSGSLRIHRIDPGSGAMEDVGGIDLAAGSAWIEAVLLP